MEKIDKKIKALKKFIEEKTDLGTANYLGKEIREICGMVESEQCAISSVGISSGVKGKYVVSCGRSGLYDLYNGNDVLICKGVNYKLLNEILGR